MKKLSKEDLTARDDYVAELNTIGNKITAAEEETNEKIAEVNELLQEYNNVIHNVSAWRDKILDEMEKYVDSQEDDWGDTQEGSDYDNWMSEVGNLDINKLELVNDLEMEDRGLADELVGVPESPE